MDKLDDLGPTTKELKLLGQEFPRLFVYQIDEVKPVHLYLPIEFPLDELLLWKITYLFQLNDYFFILYKNVIPCHTFKISQLAMNIYQCLSINITPSVGSYHLYLIDTP